MSEMQSDGTAVTAIVDAASDDLVTDAVTSVVTDAATLVVASSASTDPSSAQTRRVATKAVSPVREPVLVGGARPGAEAPTPSKLAPSKAMPSKAMPSEEAAGDLSGLELVTDQPDGKTVLAPASPSPSVAGPGGPHRDVVLAGSDRPRRRRMPVPVPALVALVVLVALAGVTVPLALRDNGESAYLTSSGGETADGGAAVETSPGAAQKAGVDPAGVPVVTLSGAPASAQPGQRQADTRTTAGVGGTGGGTAPAGGASQPAGPVTTGQPADGVPAGSGTSVAPQGDGNTPAPPVPGVPGLKTRAVSGGVEVTVTAPAEGGAATSYVVAADPGGSKSLSAPGTVTIPVAGCAKTTVSARAVNAGGTSAAATGTLVGCVAPSVPRGITLKKLPPTASDPTGQILISWSAPAETGGPDVKIDYVVRVYIYANNTVSVSTYPVTGTSFLRNNASGRDPFLKVTVTARNPAGESAEIIGYSGDGPTDPVGGTA